MSERLALRLEPVALDLIWKDTAANLSAMDRAIQERLAETPEVPAEERLFVYPELTLTGFVTDTPESSALSRGDAPVREALALARKHRVGIVFGFPEKSLAGGKPTNTLLLVSPEGEIVASYRKMHLFTQGKMPESAVYQAGEYGTIADYRGWKIGFGICFDLRFPGLFQRYARSGVDLTILPACWVGGPSKAEQFKVLAAAHAVMTQGFFMVVNRSGSDPFFNYEGESHVFGPRAEALAVGKGSCRLDPVLLDMARGLSVRSAERAEYLLGPS